MQSTFWREDAQQSWKKYASLQKKQFPAITVALLYLVNLNKRGGYFYLSNLINWKNFEDFSIQTTPFLVHRETVCSKLGSV